ncbi:hypothetical protein [Fibrobacter sp. UBA4309]|nr:hypothetical protein [Fibrobacter sp. UBA4309]
MKNKKTYIRPQMKVCKVDARTALMQSSNPYYGPAGFRDCEKDYFA